MDSIAAILLAVSVLVPVLAKAFIDIFRIKRRYDILWNGICARGFVEAQKCGHIKKSVDGTWIITDEARTIYVAVGKELRDLFRNLKIRLSRFPTDAEFTWEIEQDPNLQAWMVVEACPKLGVNQHGCLAIACVIVKEQEGADG